MKHPLTIYLDTSYYSTLSNSERERSAEEEKCHEYIMNKINSGEIEVRYSPFIVAEAMHDNISVHSHAVERAKLIKMLCQGKCFRAIFPVIFDIVANHCAEKQGNPITPIILKKDNGDYFNFASDLNLIPDFKKEVLSNIKGIIQNSGMSRSERRAYQRKIISPKGHLTKYGIQQYAENLKENTLFENTSNNLINLSDFMSKEVLLKIFSGDITDEQAIADILPRMMDIEFLIERASLEKPEMQTTFRHYITGEGLRLIEASESLMDIISINMATIKNAGIETKEMNRLIAKCAVNGTRDGFTKAVKNFYYENEQKAKERNITKKLWDECVNNLQYGDIPVLGIYFCLIRDLLMKRIKNANSKTKQSDMPDVLHACYAPFCDIMQVDSRTYALLQEIKKELNLSTVFVKHLNELPQAIENMLNDNSLLKGL